MTASSNRELFDVAPNIMIHASGIKKTYGILEVLRNVNISVPKGSVACIIGPSGSGKSTFFGASITRKKSTATCCLWTVTSWGTGSREIACSS